MGGITDKNNKKMKKGVKKGGYVWNYYKIF